MTILGEYSYANYSIINTFDIHVSGIESTHLHEMIHLALTSTTEYGFFVKIIDRVVKFDPAYEYLDKILIKHMLKLQEGVSTFCEIIYYAEKSSFRDTIDYLKELKNSNRKYYNYIYPYLSGLLFYTDRSRYDRFNIPPLDLFDIVYKLAYIAMNCSLVMIPIDIMLSKKKFKIYVEQDNPNLYIPNNRFKTLIRSLNSILKSMTSESYDKNTVIINTLKIIDNHEFYIDIISDARKKEHYTQSYINITKKYIHDLFSKSAKKDIIFETINMFNAKYVDIQRLHHHVVPSTFKPMYKIHKVDDKDILKCTKNDRGIFFIIMDNFYKKTINTSSMYVNERIFEIMQNNYPYHIQLMYMSLLQKKSFSTMYPIKNLNFITLQDRVPIVVNYKLTKFIESLPASSIIKLFIYCDRPYSSAIETINEYAKEKKRTKILAYNELYIVVIRINEKIDFFLPIIANLFHDVVNDVNNNVLNLIFDDNLEIDFHEYDLIINTLFNL